MNRCAGHLPAWNYPARCVGKGGEESCVGVKAQPEEDLGSGLVQRGGVKAQFGRVRKVFLVEDV